MSSTERTPTQAEKLRKIMDDLALNPRKLAHLMHKDDARRAATRRVQISKWVNPRTDRPGESGTISDDNAREIIAAINKSRKGRYPPDYLVKPRPRRSSVDDLAEQFAAKFDAIERRQQELADELRKLQEAL